MAFTAKDVKELREMTGCGMMDCKKALTTLQVKSVYWLRLTLKTMTLQKSV